MVRVRLGYAIGKKIDIEQLKKQNYEIASLDSNKIDIEITLDSGKEIQMICNEAGCILHKKEEVDDEYKELMRWENV